MPVPSYEQVRAYSQALKQLASAAIAEFLEKVPSDATSAEVRELAYEVGMKYRILSSEIGAQWYDWCAKMAGVDVEPAEIEEADYEQVKGDVDGLLDSEDWVSRLDAFMENMVVQTARQTGHNALWRDYERGLGGGKWARVPVGETCAWCIMLASNGAWYHSEESALGASPDHYHSNCDCVAVFYADAEEIGGYEDLLRYKEMYYEADNARMANASGRSSYDDELRERIEQAKARSQEEYRAKLDKWERDKAMGKRARKPRPWSKYNEDLIVMRYLNGLEH